MRRIRIYRGSRASGGARILARALGGRTIARTNTRFRPRPTDTIINWGCGARPEGWDDVVVVNTFSAVRAAIDKLETFRALSEHNVPTLEWSEDREDAVRWRERGSRVIVRNRLKASQGRGIQVIETRGDDDIPNAPLYTRYFRAEAEYRIHVMGGRVFDRQRKRRRTTEEITGEQRNGEDEATETSNEIRNHDGGWVYCREGVEPIAALDEACTAAVKAVGLDFAGVDARYSRTGRCAVIEVNSAVGLGGRTSRDRWAAALHTYIT